LMESVSSCIFFSQVLSCLTNNSSVFPLITIISSSSEILSSVCSILWNGLPFCFVFQFILFSEVFLIVGYFLLILSIFALNLFISLFMVISVSVWYLFKVYMISFICFCVFSYFKILLSVISWVPPVHFGWPCLLTSLWNFH
jgi:hypothetical protein